MKDEIKEIFKDNTYLLEEPEVIELIQYFENKKRTMKAKLIFNIPDDKYEFDMAVNGSNWRHVAWEMYQYIRGKTKYAPDDTHDEYLKAMSDCRDELFRIMQENGVDFDL